MAYLITCSGSKNKPNNHNPSSLNSLSFSDELNDAREKLLQLCDFNLDWNKTLPAWQLYSGNRSKLYPRVSANNWKKEGSDIKILSALFGWIKHSDNIPYYDLRMSNTILNYNNKKVHEYWHDQNVLCLFVNNKDIDLLSGEYRKAITGNINPVATESGEQFRDRYGVHKGIWLNKQLDNI